MAGVLPYIREEAEYLISIQAFFNSVTKLRLRTRAKAPPWGRYARSVGSKREALNRIPAVVERLFAIIDGSIQ